MALIPVVSSNIEAVGYDNDKSVLTVQFRGGRQYRYFEVPKEHFDEMLMRRDNKGIGKYFGEKIKKGGFKFEKIEEEEYPMTIEQQRNEIKDLYPDISVGIEAAFAVHERLQLIVPSLDSNRSVYESDLARDLSRCLEILQKALYEDPFDGITFEKVEDIPI